VCLRRLKAPSCVVFWQLVICKGRDSIAYQLKLLRDNDAETQTQQLIVQPGLSSERTTISFLFKGSSRFVLGGTTQWANSTLRSCRNEICRDCDLRRNSDNGARVIGYYLGP